MTVPNLWDKAPEAPSQSELNPLTNPLLEQNLGRWAKVYFGAPPAKREQAVNNLLEEIKRESAAGTAAQPSRPYFANDPKFQRPVCAACQHLNPPGHKFCSRCGQVLNLGQPGPTESMGAPAILDALPPNSASEKPWLHDQAFSSLEGSGTPHGRGWKYLVGAAVLVVAGFAYLHWAPEFRAKVLPNAKPLQVSEPVAALPPQESSPTGAKAPTETVVPESIVSRSKKQEIQNPRVTADARDRTVVPTGVQPAVQKSTLLASRPVRSTVSDQGSGSPDLQLAERYLGGSMGIRDPSEAAKLLWKAVGKQNATAAVLLSGLYMRGDGVPRNCDQARLLLVAAAKRGSPLAAQQLRNLESQGCR